MASKSPAMVVRVAGNIEDLRAALKESRGEIVVTSAALSRLADSFQGDKLIQRAHTVTAAIQQVGVATLSTAEGGRSIDVLDKAMDKLLRTGQQVPLEMSKTAAELRRMARAGDEADASVSRITANYRQFDGILQSAGIHIGPYVKGLEDLAAFAGRGALSLGLLGTAGAVLAAAFGGWKIGRAIAEFADLDTKIGEATSRLLGYGDVAAEVAGAQQDVMNRAIATGWDGLTGYSGAIAWTMEIERQATEQKKNATLEAEAHAEAIRQEERATWSITETNTDHFRQLQQQLDAVKEKKLADARASFAASQAQSIFRGETQTATVAIKEQTAALDAREASIKQIQDAEAKRKAENDAFMHAPTLNDRDAFSVSSDIPRLTGAALDDVISRFHQAGDQTDDQALERALATLEGQEGRVKATDNRSFFQLQSDTLLLAQLRQLLGDRRRPDHFAGGVENFAGGLAYVHKNEMLVDLPKGTSVIPAGRSGGSVTLAPVLNFYGPVGTADFESLVSAALLNIYRSSAIALPANL